MRHDLVVAQTWLSADVIVHASGQPEVIAAANQFVTAVDGLLKTPPLRRPGVKTAHVVASLRATGIHGCAGLCGASVPEAGFAQLRTDGSPIATAISVCELLFNAANRDAAMFIQQPPRALAAWHVSATSTISDMHDDLRGRPRVAGAAVVDDPLNCRLPASDASEVLMNLMVLLSKSHSMSATLLAAAVHGLLVAGQPFASANSLLGRTAARVVLIANATDPDGLVPFNAILLQRGRPEYVNEIRQLAGAADPVAAWGRWLRWHCELLEESANHARAFAAAQSD